MNHGPLIDTHQHPVPEVYRRALATVGIMGSGENPWPEWSLDGQLELMDRLGIAAVVQSVASPGVYFGDIEFAKRIARECNEDAARMIADHPAKFGAHGVVPLPDVEAACREAAYALDTLKLDGICLLSHTGPRYLGHPDDDELYGELDRRSAVVFIHPLRNEAKNVPDYSYPAGMTELVFDTTRAFHNMLWNGTFGKFPNIKWIMPHGGGTVPFLAYRINAMDHRPKVRDKLPGGSVASALRGLYYDVAAMTHPAPIKALMEIADPSHVVFGSDFPFSRHVTPSWDLEDTIKGFAAFDGWDAATRRGIEYDNAMKLFPRLKQAIARASDK